MELSKIKISILQGLGWLSVIIGLFALIIINISLLSGYKVPFMDQMSLLVLITVIMSVISLFNKQSRSLGLWGFGICAYIGFFTICIFIFGWAIIPFP